MSTTRTAHTPFHPVVADWFGRAFAEPTEAQSRGWPSIASGSHTLIVAPTGSGKTLAAFLWGINNLVERRLAGDDTGRIVYISPLKALNYDVERNLRGPLVGIADAARRHGHDLPPITVGVRTGDTPQRERRRMLRMPPDILITTPESLFLLLTSRGVDILAGTTSVIIDEIHAVAGTKRGTHLAISLERLAQECPQPLQRVGLSATQRPLEEIARFLGGNDDGTPRPVTIVDAGNRRPLDLEVVVPVDDMADLANPGAPTLADPVPAPGSEPTNHSIWPAVYPALLDLVLAHRSTLIFVNNRRLAERLALRLNELAERDIARAHHGSLAADQRVLIEEDLKAGRLPALVATSSLELGIDMGAIDLVIQVESPRSVARGLQRVGRSGHHVGGSSRGRIFPKYRGDLLECAAVVANMRTAHIESTSVPRRPLDVLAQQIVAIVAEAPWTVDDIHALVRRSYPFEDLSREHLEGVIDMLSGRYPSDEFAELAPRVVWDRVDGTVRGRRGARQLAVQNAGTIPDRGLYGVFLVDGGTRVGELDEEMVYEARVGQTFLLGASTWRIEEITRDRVLVSPAPGAPGSIPFWHGEGVGRPYELGVQVGQMARELLVQTPDSARERLMADCAFDERAARNLLSYLQDQVQATGQIPSDRTIVVERFRDEIGDWRLCILSPFGARVHAPWAMAIQAKLRDEAGITAHAIWTDDGIAIHFPDADEAPAADLALVDPDECEELIIGEIGSTALFGARFRENAARALLIPRRRPGTRTPLWQQRLRASSLLSVARRYPTFPIVLETYRECMNDWFDLGALTSVLRRVQSREIAVVETETASASPFAGALLFEYVATYMYEDDTPAAEKRATALALDRDLLRELLGQEELRDLIDADALRSVEDDLQHRSERRRVRSADGVHDLVRRLGALSDQEIAERVSDPELAPGYIAALHAERRIAPVRIAGDDRWMAAEDAGRYRDGVGAVPPTGLPDAFLEQIPDALRELAARHARTNGPFTTGALAERLGLDEGEVGRVLAELHRTGVLVRGEIRPGGSGREWCDADVLRRLRRASLAAARREIEPIDPAVVGQFLPAWQGLGSRSRTPGPDGLREIIAPLQGIALPAPQWEAEVFPSRLGSYSPTWIDHLAASGEVLWVGAGSLGRDGGRIAIYLRDDADLLGPPPTDVAPDSPITDAIRAVLRTGAAFWDQIRGTVDAPDADIFTELWALVWAGEVTNDLWAPLRMPRKLPQRPTRPRFGRRGHGSAGASARGAASGRWSLTEHVLGSAVETGDRARAVAEILLERHGVVTRAGVRGDGVPGGFAGVYRALTDLETLGRCRRGYFLAGMGGAQFALPGAVERLRDLRDADPSGQSHRVLGAGDPAQPYGASLPWPTPTGPGRPSRTFGAQVVLIRGIPVLYVERGGRKLITLGSPDEQSVAAAADTLATWVRASSSRRLVLEMIDGEPAWESPVAPHLRDAGFVSGHRGLELRGEVSESDPARKWQT